MNEIRAYDLKNNDIFCVELMAFMQESILWSNPQFKITGFDKYKRKWWQLWKPKYTYYVKMMFVEHAADVKSVVHGRWIVLNDDWEYITCNNCRCQNSIRTEYCPNCGARMDEVE